ncbi:MAG: hypothetical protein ACYSTX_03280 [Planctomycetota bacterium]|jgi:hypothetical protein
MEDLSKLSLTELEGKKRSLQITQMGISSVGMVGGFVYANRTGGGFWRYVGYSILGSIATGSIGYFTTMQRINKINTFIAKEKEKRNK